MKKGFDDFWAMPTHIVYLALIYPVAGLIIGGATYDNDTIQLLYPLAAGFALLGPLAAIWTYELTGARTRPRYLVASRLRRFLFAVTSRNHRAGVQSARTVCGLGSVRTGDFLLQLRRSQDRVLWELASLVANTREGLNVFIFGNLAGLLFAIVAGATTVIAFPMLLDRRVSAGAAVATSLSVVAKNPGVMAAWGLIVAAILLVASLPFLVGLALAVPILGHSTWHLYRKAVEPPIGERPVREARDKGVRYAADFPACLFSRSRES